MRSEFKIEIPTSGVWKFVKVNGQFRWISGESMFCNHSDCVLDGEVAQAAGTIIVRDDSWELTGQYSQTLKIGCTCDTMEELVTLLNKPERAFNPFA